MLKLFKQPKLKRQRELFNNKREYSHSRHVELRRDLSGLAEGEFSFENTAFEKISKYVSDPLETVFFVYSNYVKYKNASKRFSYENLLFITEKLVEYPKSFQILDKLSAKSQFYILFNIILAAESSYIIWEQSYSVSAHLEALELANYPRVAIIDNSMELESLVEFSRKTNRKLNASCNRAVSEDFKKSKNDVLMSTSKSYKHFNSASYLTRERLILGEDSSNFSTIILLLRIVYGEESMLEILKRILEEDIEWTLLEIVELAKDWDNLKEYPLSWSLATMSDQ